MGPGALRGRRAVTFLLSRCPRLPHSPSWAEGHGCGSGNHGLPIPGSWEGHSRCGAASQSTGPRGRHGEALGRQPTPPRPHERGPAPHLQARPLSAQARTPGKLWGAARRALFTTRLRGAAGVLARTRACMCVWKSLSPRMSGSHVFKIQAHFSEVISGKMLTLITAIKGKYCLSQHKCLFGARLRSTGLFVYVGNSSLGVQRLGSRWAPGGQRAVSESPSLSTSVWWPDLLAPGSRMGSEAFAPRG